MEQCHASWVELQGFRLIYKINTNKNKCFQTFFNKNFAKFFFSSTTQNGKDLKGLKVEKLVNIFKFDAL